MSTNRSRHIAAALGVSMALALGAAGVSYAVEQAPRQLQPNTQTARPDQDRQNDRAGRRQQFEDRARDRLEGRLGYLHSALKITAAQDRLWNAFADVVRDEQGNAGARFDRGRGAGPDRGPDRGANRGFDRGRDRDRGADRDRDRDAPSVVDRLERRQQNLADRSTQMNKLLTALRPLYAALSPEQKRLADENLFRPERQRMADSGRFGRGRFGGDRFYGDRFGRGPFGGPDNQYR